ncbi:hypothetical protein AB0G02_37130, partial [Actinosynnema sp. NPDC023658]|uniref:hypothetical protein n=1 Tax=Actinosynnema sp. NPDC023658 TaxID=3155465 RepID=UPI0033E33E28
GDGIITEGDVENPGHGDWLVKASGFTFGTDTQVPLSRIELATGRSDQVIGGQSFGVHPMGVTGLRATQRVQVLLEGQRVDLGKWKAVPQYTALPPQLWDDSGDPEHGEGQRMHLTGVTLTSPDIDYGASTGYIGEDTFKFDPNPNGLMPLSADDVPLIPAPTRPAGVLDLIAATVDTAPRSEARSKVHALMNGLGLTTGGAKTDLPGYAKVVTRVFTAEPMLLAAGTTNASEGAV